MATDLKSLDPRPSKPKPNQRVSTLLLETCLLRYEAKTHKIQMYGSATNKLMLTKIPYNLNWFQQKKSKLNQHITNNKNNKNQILQN